MRYLIVALVVSLAWLHQDWFVWPLLAELNDQNNFLSWLVAEEHEVKFGIPANVGFQLFLSFATAAVALLAVWKAWPTELERWAEAGRGNRGNHGNRGYRDRNRERGGRNRGGRNRPRGEGGRNSGRSTERTERSAGRKPGQDDSSRPQSKESDDSSDRPRRRRRRGGRGRGGNGEGNSQSQPKGEE